MKHLLLIISLLFSLYAMGQTPSGSKVRYQGAWYICKDTATATSADTASMLYQCRDSTFYGRALGAWYPIVKMGSSGLFVKIADSSNMLSGYVRKGFPVLYTDTASMLSNRLKISDTTTMLSGYGRSGQLVKYSDTATQLSGYQRKNFSVLYTDSAAMLSNLLRKTDTSTQLSGYLRKNFAVLYTDSAAMLANYERNGFGVKYIDTASMLSTRVKYSDTAFLNSNNVKKSGSTMTGYLSLVGDPTAANHAATKNYVDNIATGLSWKPQAKAATTGNITLSGTQTVDGIALVAGDTVFVKNQTTTSQNGFYIVSAGAWSRATWGTTGAQILGSSVFVRNGGTINGGTQWANSNTIAPTVGTDPITFTQIAGAGVYTNGPYLSLTGNVFDVNSTYSGQWNTAYTNRITSLTTTGSSGASTLSANVLNVPAYTLAGLGGVPTTTTVAGFSLASNVTLASLTNGWGVLGGSYNGASTIALNIDTTAYHVATKTDLSSASTTAASTYVSLTGNQTIAGTKTFSSTIAGSITGNAATVTNGIYTTSSFFLGTTSIPLNRASAAQTLTGISIDGNAASETLQTVAARGNTYTGSIGLNGASTPAWGAGYGGISISSSGNAIWAGPNDIRLSSNTYYNGTNYIITNSATVHPSLIYITDYLFNLYSGTTGAIGATTTLTNTFSINTGTGTVTTGIWNAGAVTSSGIGTFNGGGVISAGSSSNTIGAGAYIEIFNNAASRGWITQLNASQNLDNWYWNGTSWVIKQTFGNDGSITFNGRTRVGGSYIADISGTGNNLGIAFGSTGLLPTDGSGSYAVKDLGQSASPWGAAYFSSSVTATSFIKSGGTSSQFLMADGSVNTTTAGVGTSYTATLANSSNIASYSFVQAQYIRSGNVVYVTISANATAASANTLTSLQISLPINTATTTQNYIGSGTSWIGASSVPSVVTITGAGTAVISWYPTGTSPHAITATFSYTL